jgi:hypothetical protein
MRSAQIEDIPSNQFEYIRVMGLLAILHLYLLRLDRAHGADSHCLLHATHSELSEGIIVLECFKSKWHARDDFDDGCIVLWISSRA